MYRPQQLMYRGDYDETPTTLTQKVVRLRSGHCKSIVTRVGLLSLYVTEESGSESLQYDSKDDVRQPVSLSVHSGLSSLSLR